MGTKIVNGWMPNSAYDIDSPEIPTAEEFDALEQEVATVSGLIPTTLSDLAPNMNYITETGEIFVTEDGAPIVMVASGVLVMYSG